MENSTESHKMQPMTAKEAAAQVIAHIYGNVDAFRARPPRKAEQFAAAGLMRCCALLKGILVLDEARMSELAGILVRLHWETWLVSLYVLLVGDKALKALDDDVKYRKSLLPEPLLDDFEHWMQHLIPEPFRLEGDHQHPDSVKEPKKLLASFAMHELVTDLLRERGESVDSPTGATAYDVTYRWESLVSGHANLPTITRHLVDVDDGGLAVSVDSSEMQNDAIALGPVLYTNHLAQSAFKKFGLDGAAMNSFVATIQGGAGDT